MTEFLSAQPARWFNKFRTQLWLAYHSEQSLVELPKRTTEEHGAIGAMTRTQRSLLIGHPEVHAKRH